MQTDLKSAIHPAALDLMLCSASNASQKGQSQYSTPVELATAIAKELPSFRPVIVDLTCGNGQLLTGCANKTTDHILGCDIDPSGGKAKLPVLRRSREVDMFSSNDSLQTGQKVSFIHSDLTLLYALMRQIDFRADCFALNPPWSLNWHAERLEGLADSAVPAVARTFKAVRAGSDTIDSTLATLMIALDRLSGVGEGFLIGYASTLDRLLFAPGAIGEELVQHIWKRMPSKPADVAPTAENAFFDNAVVLFFSANHDGGPTADGRCPRFLTRINAYNSHHDTLEQWKALAERVRTMQSDAPPAFHLTLRGNEIYVRLGLFDTALVKVNRKLAKTAKRLNDLNGRNPMQVVMQRDERNFILGLLRPGAEWTVDPALRDAVKAAVGQYNAIRAPLVPLPKIQRLGYLDENDDILCLKDLGEFRAGTRYPLSTRSMRFTRTQMKPNLHGEDEELELSGQELAIFIKSDPSEESEGKCFMDSSLRASNVRIGEDDGADVVDFTLQQLVDHFEIPDVPDVAAADPDQFNIYVEQLHQLEQLTT